MGKLKKAKKAVLKAAKKCAIVRMETKSAIRGAINKEYNQAHQRRLEASNELWNAIDALGDMIKETAESVGCPTPGACSCSQVQAERDELVRALRELLEVDDPLTSPTIYALRSQKINATKAARDVLRKVGGHV